jgi:hypothetical protein
MKTISLNTFLEREFKFCWVCGAKEYNEFYIGGCLYRVCWECIKTNRNGVTTFLSKLQKESLKVNK